VTGTARPIACCLAAVFAVAAFAGCNRGSHSEESKASASADEKPATKPVEVRVSKEAIAENHVEIGTVSGRVLTPTFAAPARVAFNAEAMAHVGAPVAGRVAELKVRLGDPVKKGDELLTIESPDLGEAQSDFLQKRTALAAVTAAVEPARIAYERGKSLFEQNQGLALAEVQKREADLKAAQAAMQSAAATLKGAQNKLALLGMNPQAVQELERTGTLTPSYSIRAPISGQVIQCDLTPGALVGPDKDLQVELADVARVWVLADVPEAYYGRLRKGAAAHVIAGALGDRTFDGTVSLLAPALDPSTRTLQTRIDVNNPEGLLRPGMLARAEIESAEAKVEKVLAVPADAVMPFEDETIVFAPVEGNPEKFKRIEVTIGQAVGGWVPVLSGLSDGEKIVVRGAFILKAQLSKPPEE
jgi:cobalt-zinc-cadmium efflux system membrane fusion protein